jgi:hypothetical protein
MICLCFFFAILLAYVKLHFLFAARRLRYHGQMLLLFETPSGFALFTFFGGHCYLPDSVNVIVFPSLAFVNDALACSCGLCQ